MVEIAQPAKGEESDEENQTASATRSLDDF